MPFGDLTGANFSAMVFKRFWVLTVNAGITDELDNFKLILELDEYSLEFMFELVRLFWESRW